MIDSLDLVVLQRVGLGPAGLGPDREEAREFAGEHSLLSKRVGGDAGAPVCLLLTEPPHTQGQLSLGTSVPG